MGGFRRRPSDSFTFALLRWVFVILSVAGLLSFGVDRIIRVVKRDHVFENKVIDAEGVPDLLFCASNATVKYKEGFNITAIPIKGPKVPLGLQVFTPCDTGDTMFIATTDFTRLMAEHNPGKHVQRLLDPNADMTLEIHVEVNSTDPIKVAAISSREDIYRQTVYIPASLNQALFRASIKFQLLHPNESGYMTPEVKLTKRLQGGFFGLLTLKEGDHDHDQEVSSSMDITNSPNYTRIMYRVPDKWVMNEEVLIMSIPDALASWGGVFSLVVSVYYVLFGSRQMSPFGIIQTYLLQSSTKRAVKNVYGKQIEDYGHGNNSNLQEQEVLPDPIPLPSSSSCTNDSTRLQNTYHPEEAGESPHAGVSVTISPEHEEGLSSQSGSRNMSMEEMQEELALLRNFMREHQQRSKHFEHFESLVKDLYLDMGLVEKAIPSSRLGAVRSISLRKTATKTRNWIQRLFRRS
ncbi:hypothetical protein B0O80DRAFT_500781 [Mortierella sp. GBAus27b]|nr:hypothetical protein B0O80DRAFT_500781 [Mortierella sp. GBAus27b]